MRDLLDVPGVSHHPVRLRVETVDAFDGTLADRYVELLAARKDPASPFLSLEWLRLVARHRPATRVVVARRGATVTGFFGFEVDGDGHGRPIGSTWSDHQASIGDVGRNAQTLLRAIGARAFRFDHLDPSCALLAPSASRRAESPVIDLVPDHASYVATVTARSDVLKRTAALRRRLERDVGPVRLERHRPEVLDTLLGWKREQYARTGVPDPFDDPQDLALVRAVAGAEAVAAFDPWLSVLWAGDVVVAAHLGIRGHRELAYWLPSYDPALAAYSPGRLLLVELAALAGASGLDRIDLGKGDEEYKQRLATGSVGVLAGVVERRTWRKGVRIVRSSFSARLARR